MQLTLHPDRYGICRLAADAEIPDWACRAFFFSITRTARELSLVCPEKEIPSDVLCEKGWRMFQVVGALDFGLTGVISALTHPLAVEKIPVFVFSTYETDYLLVKEDTLARAETALISAGFGIH